MATYVTLGVVLCQATETPLMHQDSGHRRLPSGGSLIDSLRRCTGLADAQLCAALAERSGHAAPTLHLLHAWDSGVIAMPAWVERFCAEWIVELWRSERSTCDARALLTIDRKYTRLLSDYSVGDLMTVLQIKPHCAA